MPARNARTLIVANWKAYLSTRREAIRYAAAFAKELARLEKGLGISTRMRAASRVSSRPLLPDIVLCPPLPLVVPLKDALAASGVRSLSFGVQDVAWQEAGPATGALTVPLVKDVGASQVIVGHSERRRAFHEDDEEVRRKLHAVLAGGLRAILCVGEQERPEGDEEAREALGAVKTQLFSALEALGGARQLSRLTVAYEPVWAITGSGSGMPDTPENAARMATFLRRLAAQRLGDAAGKGLRVLYGGSVSSRNAGAFAAERALDGFLVGSASTHPKEFAAIIAHVVTARR